MVLCGYHWTETEIVTYSFCLENLNKQKVPFSWITDRLSDATGKAQEEVQKKIGFPATDVILHIYAPQDASFLTVEKTLTRK